MTRGEFREWLQTRLTQSPCHQEQGDTWREIEAEGLLPEGVTLAVDHLGCDFVFGLEDGMLASTFGFGIEGETTWGFDRDDVGDNLREYCTDEAAAAVRAMHIAASELGDLLRGDAVQTGADTEVPTAWFAAAAYGDRDYGEGPTRLFTRVYDHGPTEAEIRRDAFVEAVPDWPDRYPRYTLHAAAYEWEGTLADALAISVIPATAAVPPPTVMPLASPPHEV